VLERPKIDCLIFQESGPQCGAAVYSYQQRRQHENREALRRCGTAASYQRRRHHENHEALRRKQFPTVSQHSGLL
jgi:hypothetical protein